MANSFNQPNQSVPGHSYASFQALPGNGMVAGHTLSSWVQNWATQIGTATDGMRTISRAAGCIFLPAPGATGRRPRSVPSAPLPRGPVRPAAKVQIHGTFRPREGPYLAVDRIAAGNAAFRARRCRTCISAPGTHRARRHRGGGGPNGLLLSARGRRSTKPGASHPVARARGRPRSCRGTNETRRARSPGCRGRGRKLGPKKGSCGQRPVLRQRRGAPGFRNRHAMGPPGRAGPVQESRRPRASRCRVRDRRHAHGWSWRAP
jgi:hypothetical protein